MNTGHEFVNSDRTKFDSNCAVCDGKQRDAVHALAGNELLVAILPNGVRGFISLACSDEDCESFIAQTRAMGADSWARVPDTADFCEEAI